MVRSSFKRSFCNKGYEMMTKVLVSGANGFIGSELSSQLIKRKYSVNAVVRSFGKTSLKIESGQGLENFEVGEINAETSWSEPLNGVDCVIHCAGKAHITNKLTHEYKKVNIDGTCSLAQQAAEAGVKRFIFLSTIKVNGEITTEFSKFSCHDAPCPEDEYSKSKWTAEKKLHEISKKTGLDVVIIRPPLVYGPGVKGNFHSLLTLVSMKLPLPFGSLTNYRSIVGLENLINLLILCIDHPAARGQTFLVKDNQDLSVVSLIRRISKIMNKSKIILPVPIYLLKLLGIIGKKSLEVNRLINSLQIDDSHTRKLLGWKPSSDISGFLEKTVNWYLSNK